jgi:tetratricopeptide (TPR) repeat protein
MTSHDRPSTRCLLLVLLVGLLGLGLPAAAGAQADSETPDIEALRLDRQAKAMRYPVRARISRYLGAAAKLIDEEKPDEAEALLLRLNPARMNPYERALVYRMIAFIAYGSQQHEKAIEAFKKVLDEQVLPIRDESKIRFSIAQLYAGLEEWAESILWVDQWRRYEAEPDPLGFYLKAIAQYQMGDFDAAIASTQEAIARGQPREAWLRLLAALYAEKQDYVKATPVLEELVLRYPKKQYWVQLSLIYGAREDYDISLAVQQMAYQQGLLSEDKELRRLARSHLYHDLPYPAAKVLAKGLEDGVIEADADAYELLANSWVAARDYNRALTPLQQAAALSDDGNLFVRLGQVHMQREEWGDAVTAFKKALEKGSLKKQGNAVLLIGVALYNDSQAAQAQRYFVQAREFEDSKAEANRWITHIAQEGESQSG